MATHQQEEITRKNVLEITALARTLQETSESLLKLAVGHHPNLDQAKWMMNASLRNTLKAFSQLRKQP